MTGDADGLATGEGPGHPRGGGEIPAAISALSSLRAIQTKQGWENL